MIAIRRERRVNDSDRRERRVNDSNTEGGRG